MNNPKHPIREYMTPFPHTIGVDQSLRQAATRMRALGARHLPVLRGGTVVGVISDRDLAFFQSYLSDNIEDLPVEEAMTPEPYVVGPEMPIGVVVRTMADRKMGSVIVTEASQVVGILTTTDALGLLADVFAYGGKRARPESLPHEVRERITEDHRRLQQELKEAHTLAGQVLHGTEEAAPKLQHVSRDLYQSLLRHIALEAAILVPALRETPGFGEVRANKLLENHKTLKSRLQTGLAALDSTSAAGLAKSIQELVPAVLEDMKEEQEKLLSEAVLKDDPIQTDAVGG